VPKSTTQQGTLEVKVKNNFGKNAAKEKTSAKLISKESFAFFLNSKNSFGRFILKIAC
jgi:hypothetical protein